MATNNPNPPANGSGPNAWDDALKVPIMDLLEKFAPSLANSKTVQKIVEMAGPLAMPVAKGFPTALAYLLAKVPDRLLGGNEAADFIRDVAVEAARNLDRIVEKVKRDSPEAWSDAVSEATKKVGEQAVIIDDLNHFHLPDCIKMLDLKRRREATRPPPPTPARQQHGNQGQPPPAPAPQPAPSPVFIEIARASALKQGLKASPCCFTRVEEAAPVVPPKPRKFRSPAEVIGAAKPEQQARLKAILAKLTGDTKTKFINGLMELDSIEELDAVLVIGETEDSETMLKLLENQNAARAAKNVVEAVGRWFKEAGGSVAGAISHAMADLKALDNEFAPEVEKQKTRFAQPRDSKPKKKFGWSIRKLFGIW